MTGMFEMEKKLYWNVCAKFSYRVLVCFAVLVAFFFSCGFDL